MLISRHLKRVTLVSTCVAAALGGVVIASSSADLPSQINANKQAAASLQSQINSDTAQIEKTAGGVAAAQGRLSTVQSELSQHITELQGVDDRVMKAGQQLDALEKKLHIASRYLAANLRAAYESGSPNLVDVVLPSVLHVVDLIEQAREAVCVQHDVNQIR